MKISVYLFLMTSLVSFSVFSDENIESDNDQRLLTSCQVFIKTPQKENIKPCIYFIQGFLAAAQAVDQPVITQQTMENRKPFGLTSRPYHSRERLPPKRFFPFCVPDDKSIVQLTTDVSKQLSHKKPDTTKALSDTIFNTLKNEYPCG